MAARQFLPAINRGGGRSRDVDEAVKQLERLREPNALFLEATTRIGRDGAGDPSRAIADELTLPERVVLRLERMGRTR